MNMKFMFGVFLGTFLLIKIEFSIILLIFTLGLIFPTLEILFTILSIVIAVILILGHIKTTISIFMSNNYESAFFCEEQKITNNFKQDLFSNLLYQGIKWRFLKEIKYIKEIASLNFKYIDTNATK